MIHTLSHLLAGISDINSQADVRITGLCNDSRQIKAGDVFLAYPGERVDSRTLIAEVLQKAAAAVLYEPSDLKITLPTSANQPCIPIENLQEKQSQLASRFYQDPTAHMCVIGVTGTNGKTSCTQFIAQALLHHGENCAVVGTLGAGIWPDLHKTLHTTPDAIALLKQLDEFYHQDVSTVAMEVSSHGLVQHRVAAVKFDIAVFTQLTRDHLDYHGTMEAYAKAKEILFRHPGLRFAVVNIDDSFGKYLASMYATSLRVVTYSLKGEQLQGIQSIRVLSSTPLPTGYRLTISSPWGSGEFCLPLVGRFNISNALAVLGVLMCLEIPFEKALVYLSQLQAPAGRMQRFGGDGKPVVVVDYSHTPDALAEALQALRLQCQGRLICVFGCGGNRDVGKRSEMGTIAETHSDLVVITSDNPRTESPMAIIQGICEGLLRPRAALIIADRAQAIAKAVQSAKHDDIVLVAGKGHETHQWIGATAIPFDDRLHVQRQLALWGE